MPYGRIKSVNRALDFNAEENEGTARPHKKAFSSSAEDEKIMFSITNLMINTFTRKKCFFVTQVTRTSFTEHSQMLPHLLF